MNIIPTARKFSEDKPFLGSNINFTDRQIEEFLVEFATLHAVRIIKSLSSTELEYQRNIHLIKDIK